MIIGLSFQYPNMSSSFPVCRKSWTLLKSHHSLDSEVGHDIVRDQSSRDLKFAFSFTTLSPNSTGNNVEPRQCLSSQSPSSAMDSEFTSANGSKPQNLPTKSSQGSSDKVRHEISHHAQTILTSTSNSFILWQPSCCLPWLHYIIEIYTSTLESLILWLPPFWWPALI